MHQSARLINLKSTKYVKKVAAAEYLENTELPTAQSDWLI